MEKILNGIREFVLEWSVTILILLFGTTSVMQAFVVPTASMETTVMTGDHLIVDKLSYAPPGSISRYLLPYTDIKRGDIIVFRFPPDPRSNYVKRVIGIPGDRVKLAHRDVFVNGRKLVEPYIRRGDDFDAPYRDNFPSTPLRVSEDVMPRVQAMLEHTDPNTGELVIPPGQYFAMGDNRDNSSDCRYWGFVPRENIFGKPLINFWSYETTTENLADFRAEHFADLAQNFFKKTRWERTLKLIRGYEIK